MASPVGEVTTRCGSCGIDLRLIARFCDVCGSPVLRRPAAAEYKQVTVLFADVVGSMQLAAVLETERLREIMNELFNRSAAVVQRYQGTMDKFTGDGLMALFGAPLALEDHALRACISSMEIQSAAERFADEVYRRDGVRLQLRVGLNSGEVIAGSIGSGPGRYTAVGHSVGMAQRMEAAAPAGGVLCSLSTARLVENVARLGPVEEVAVKGTDVAVCARRLLALESGRTVVGRNEGAMVGRDADLARLHSIFDTGRSHLVGVVGAPGLGKSRLICEFSAMVAHRGAQVVLARCESHTTTVAFRALGRLLRAMFSVDGLPDHEARAHVVAQSGGGLAAMSADAQILFEGMGIADPAAPPLQVSVDGRRRRLVEVMSQAVSVRPARFLFMLEDAHWIDTPSDEVLADFIEGLKSTSSLFVMTYRPEFRGALQQHADETITLQPLTDAMSVRLVGQLVGNDPSLAVLVERIVVAAVGNPFFAEEIVRDLADRGVLLGSRGHYRLVGSVDEIGVPATVQAVLAARIDRLPVEAKTVVNAAAVIGNRFDVETLHALLPDAESSAFADLVSAELIDQTEFVPRQRYCFRHPLVRTVAYESQLSATRAQAHRRLAVAIETRDPAATDENAALIASHFEAAGEIADAFCWHMRAAEWLRGRDLPAARAQWLSARRLADRLPDDLDDVIAKRIAPRTMLISTVLYVGGNVDSDGSYRELLNLTMQTGDLRSLAIAMAGRIQSFAINDLRVPEAVSLAPELEQIIHRADCDAATASISLNAVATACFVGCQFDSALRVVDAILAQPADVPVAELAPANAIRGVIQMCCGDAESGRRHLRQATEYGRELTVLNAQLGFFWCTAVALGLYQPDDQLDQLRDALRRAESFGDVGAVSVAQWAYGTALLRTSKASCEEAIRVLESARAALQKHKVFGIALATIDADLATDAARRGQLDKAIDDLRDSFSTHIGGGFRALVGCTGEAFVELLIDRGRADDLIEAHQIVDDPRARQAGIPAMNLWWLTSRALLAKAEGDSEGYGTLAEEYLALCEKLHARGRLADARRMVDRRV